MKLHSRALLIAFLALALLGLPACASFGNHSSGVSTSRSDFVAKSDVETHELEIKPAMNYHTLEIKALNLAAGQLNLQLLRPDGNVQWRESFTAPTRDQKTFDLEAIPGTWKLEIGLESATGNYDIQWRASN